MTTECPACGHSAIRVSSVTEPDMGPLDLPGRSKHVHDGTTYYHIVSDD